MMKLEGALYPWRFRLVMLLLALMVAAIAAVSYTHLTLPTTPYV